MRKIIGEMENPLDHILLNICDQTMEFFHYYNFTPNMITTLGNIARLISVYYVFEGYKLLFVLFYLLGYFFDCLDGSYARKYNMTSKFGDYYDHFSDIVFNIILVYYIFFASTLSDQDYYWIVVIIYTLLFILLNVHLSCQQVHKGKIGPSGETLDLLKPLCISPNMIYWTRYFGSGTFISATALLAYIF